MIKRLRALFKKTAEPPIVVLGENHTRGTVVISYLTAPFGSNWNGHKERGHTNAYEVTVMAEAFHELGFRVEVTDWNNKSYVPPVNSRVVIDLHGNLDKWNLHLDPTCSKVLHATGCHWKTLNQGELNRLQKIRARKGVILESRRKVDPSYAAEVADRIVVLGNDYTMESFRFAGKPITRVPISSVYEFDWVKTEFGTSKKKFLWLGSYGMVHKGLDLVLEAFAGMPELELTVCGRPEKEADFYKLYEHELLKTPNINLHGWVDMASQEFFDLARTHGAIVYPSSSEGGAGSVIHCMHAGMVPICTRESSVDLEDFGIEIESGDVESVMDAVRAFVAMSDPEIESRARKAYEHVRRVHTRAAFAENYRKFARELTIGIP